jgi:opacity protein-like surface antigen
MMQMVARKFAVILGVLALVAFLSSPVPAKAEVYFEGFLGGVQPMNAGMDFFTIHPGTGLWEYQNPQGNYNPAVIGGLKLGTWFVKEGFLGYNYPDWMKYLGFYFEFSYHRLDNPDQPANTNPTGVGTFNPTPISRFSSKGGVATLAFMFAGRYGFLPDKEVPFGRLQPYVGIGPALFFTSMAPSLFSGARNGQTFWVQPRSQTVTTLGICVDLGLRYMVLKNVSFDIFYNYRYARPTYEYNYADPITGAPSKWEITPGCGGNGMHSGQIGVSYHF